VTVDKVKKIVGVRIFRMQKYGFCTCISNYLKLIDMNVSPIPKQIARLEARITPETKALLQKAADLEGRTLTDFVISSVQAEALRVIERHQTLKLSMSDAESFVDAILNPPQPNDALKAAALRYKQVISV